MTPYVQHNVQFLLGVSSGICGSISFAAADPTIGLATMLGVLVCGWAADRIRTRYAPWRRGAVSH